MLQVIDDKWQVGFMDIDAFKTTDDLEHKTILITGLLRRGEGTKKDPVRIIYRIYDENDKIIMEIDPCRETTP